MTVDSCQVRTFNVDTRFSSCLSRSLSGKQGARKPVMLFSELRGLCLYSLALGAGRKRSHGAYQSHAREYVQRRPSVGLNFRLRLFIFLRNCEPPTITSYTSVSCYVHRFLYSIPLLSICSSMSPSPSPAPHLVPLCFSLSNGKGFVGINKSITANSYINEVVVS